MGRSIEEWSIRGYPFGPVLSRGVRLIGRSLVTRFCRLLAALVLAGEIVSCVPPDRPYARADPLPEGLLEVLAPDTLRTLRIGEGVWYRFAWSPVGPWAIHIVEADLTRCEIGFEVLVAESVSGERRSFATVPAMAEVAGTVAAVNGDFFLREGIPAGPEVVDGEVRRVRERPAFAWPVEGGPWIGTTSGAGSGGLWIGASSLDSGTNVNVVGGLPELLDGGERVPYVETNPGFATGRHPRTGVGFTPDRDRLWLVVVDGRQSPYSAGMTLEELTAFFEELGATEVLNLDGGGSSTMVLGTHVVNRPSDGEDRSIVNGLGLLVTPGSCRAG
jgi:phosphodiester glycosidase